MSDRSHPLGSLQDIVHEDPDAAIEYLPDLVRYLRSGSVEERDAASQILAEYAQRRALDIVHALERLVEPLYRHDGRVRTNIAAAFAYVAAEQPSTIVEIEQSGQAHLTDAFAEVLRDGPEPARTNIGETLAYVSDASPETVVDAVASQGFVKLFSGSGEQRRYALIICSQAAEVTPAVVQPYIQQIRAGVSPRHPPNERVAALATLARLADESPGLVANRIDPLLETAAESDSRIRSNALGVAAIVARTHPDAVLDLRGVAAESLSAEQAGERINAAELLYRLAHQRPDELANDGIKTRLRRAEENDLEELVRNYAEMALVELRGGDASLPPEFPSIVKNAFRGDDIGSVVHDALGRTIINIEELVEDRHQNIEVTDGSRVDGDVGNTRAERPKGNRDRRRRGGGESDDQP
jgi:hypothetical protein